MSTTRATVLVAEDSKFDQMILRRAFTAAGVEAEIVFVADGEDLLDYLERRDTSQPGIVLLDLHMPRMDGREAVRRIREHERLRLLPLVMLTTSDSEAHVQELYGLGVNSYLVKPSDFDVLVALVRQLSSYWFGTVRLPRIGERHGATPASERLT